MKTDRISAAEMVALFGEEMPIKAVNLLWNAPDDWTIGELRDHLRQIAAGEAAPPFVDATPADRVAAADIGKRFAKWGDGQVSAVLDGRGDDCGMVQALARHRVASCDTHPTGQDRATGLGS